MNPPSNVSEFPAERELAPPVLSATRPLYWSIQRELWENRSIYLAPMLVAAVLLLGFFFSTFRLPQRMHELAAMNPAQQRGVVGKPFEVVAGLLMLTAFLVGVFYCLDALHGERRDRSILFWKSLPVSDRTTVLAKASIPLVVLPLFVFAIIVTAHLIILMLSTVRLLGDQAGLAMFWKHLRFFQFLLAILYALTVIALWHAPVYAWLLLLSAWARRAAILWAVLPLLVLFAFEKMAFNTSYLAKAVGYRLVGWYQQAFVAPPKGAKVAVDPLAHLTPGNFLATPGLWIGLLVAAAFLAAAVRLRRYRGPI